MSRIFLTGATGFVGGHVLRRLTGGGAHSVVCLARDPSRMPPHAGDVRVVAGSLDAPGAWAGELAGCDAVVHLAALTGKATEAEHFRASVDATRALVAAAEAAGVPRFLYMSTVAVAYPEKRAYPYARAKEEAERIVRESGLDWLILRPTVILGPGSGLWDKFLSLASAPVLPVFGSGANAIQPVHVDDVARCVADAVAADALGRRTRGFGGRDALPMKAFLQRIRRAVKGKDGPALHVPVKLLIGLLSLMEKFLFSVMPVAAGQFYVFAYDADAEPAADLFPPRAARHGVDDLISEHLAAGSGAGGAGGALTGVGAPGAAAAPSPPPDEELAAECRAFCRYLIGRDPGDYVVRKYIAAHQPGAETPAREAHDPLTAIARRGPLFARIADSWAVFFARGGTLRRKLILLVAILENVGETSAVVDSPDSGTAAGFFLGLGVKGVRFTLTLLVSVVAVPVLRLTVGKPERAA